MKNNASGRLRHDPSVVEKVRSSPMLTEKVKDFLFSQQFAEGMLKEFASNVSKVLEHLQSRCKAIPFFRKSILLNMDSLPPNSGVISRVVKLIKHILDGYPEKQQKHYSNIYTFHCPRPEFPEMDGILSTCLLKMKRQAMLSNVSLAPILLSKEDILNSVFLPGYLPVSSVSKIDQFTPELIVYTGSSIRDTKTY